MTTIGLDGQPRATSQKLADPLEAERQHADSELQRGEPLATRLRKWKMDLE